MALAKLQRKHFGEDRSHVAEAHGDVREGKNRGSFQEEIPCKLQDIMKNTPNFPGKIQPFLRSGSVVSLWRKRY